MIKDSFKNKKTTRVRINVNGKEVDKEDAIFKREEIFNSLGEMIKGLTHLEKIEEFKEYVNQNNKIPTHSSKEKFSDGTLMGVF